MKKRIFAVLVLIAFVLVGGNGLAASQKDTLVVAANIDDIITLDPAETFEFTGGEVIANVYDRIMMYEAEDTSKLVGGVAANSRLREKVTQDAGHENIRVYIPSIHLCADNAAMIAAIGYHYLKAGKTSKLDEDVFSRARF